MAEGLRAGIKNAVERGFRLERVKQSFINAGYSKRDVEKASREVSSGVLSSQTPSLEKREKIEKTQKNSSGLSELPPLSSQEKTPQQKQEHKIQAPSPGQQNYQQQKPKKKSSKTMIIIFSSILAFLLVVLIITILVLY